LVLVRQRTIAACTCINTRLPRGQVVVRG